MYPHDYRLEAAKAMQKAILDEILSEPAQGAPEFESDRAEQQARRRFFRAYQFRSLLFRLAPQLAARHLL